MDLRVSIVICTYNRAAFLRRTLHSLGRLNYKNFEVIVINGPSTDDTERVLEMYRDMIKVGKNELANLSISRNIGIAMAGGDVVAFIDDDAIPDVMWLDDIVSLYEDPSVGGVGGKVIGPGDDHFQFENGYVDIWGNADVHCLDSDYNDPNGDRYNMMLGTNCTFLRKALVEAGGFDEYYDYFHDESDMCLRVVRAGYAIRNHRRAYIYHEYAKSHIRASTFDPCHLNWYPIAKNKAYFAVKNSQGKAAESVRQEQLNKIENELLENYKAWKQEGIITGKEYREYVDTCKTAFAKGKEDGHHLERQLRFDLDQGALFQQYRMDSATGAISICLLCRDDVRGAVGGTAKYTMELAKGFVRKGHLVHVITGGDSDMDWMENGISFHTIKPKSVLDCPELDNYPTTYENLNYSYLAFKRLERLNAKYGIDVAESVLWNFEGAVAARAMKNHIPIVVRLQTPLLKVCETLNWTVTEDLQLFSDFERQLILNAGSVIAISDHIKDTINEMYGVDFDKLNTSKVYLGVDENICTPKRKEEDGKLRVLFVGRLERRKGIHTIFEVLPRLMEEYPSLEVSFIGNTDIPDEKLQATYKEHFQKNYGAMNWAQRVFFLGQVGNEEKDQAFRDCDIFVGPSLYESFGIILIEAMSAAKPVIGCRIGGMQEIVEDGETGFLIEVENAEELYSRLKLLLDDAELRVQMGQKGFARFNQTFSNDAMVENTIQVYRKLIANQS